MRTIDLLVFSERETVNECDCIAEFGRITKEENCVQSRSHFPRGW